MLRSSPGFPLSLQTLTPLNITLCMQNTRGALRFRRYTGLRVPRPSTAKQPHKLTRVQFIGEGVQGACSLEDCGTGLPQDKCWMLGAVSKPTQSFPRCVVAQHLGLKWFETESSFSTPGCSDSERLDQGFNHDRNTTGARTCAVSISSPRALTLGRQWGTRQTLKTESITYQEIA